MRTLTLIAAVAAGVVLAGCGGPTESASDFVEEMRTGVSADYEPMGPPEEALAQTELVVRGSVVEVSDGMEVEYPDAAVNARSGGGYATFHVRVGDVLAGNASLVTDNHVYVQVIKSADVSSGDLASANPGPSAVVFLRDLSGWSPLEEATVARPEAMPDDAVLFFASLDGFWIQTEQDDEMVGLHADRQRLDPTWGAPRTLDDMAAVVAKCANGQCPE